VFNVQVLLTRVEGALFNKLQNACSNIATKQNADE